MGKDKIRHYRVRGGRAFWQPTKTMRQLGFMSVPLGVPGPDAKRQAIVWNNRWDAARSGVSPTPALASADNLSPDQIEELTVYPPRSVGHAFRRYRRINEWALKAPRTREEWWRAWQRIKPIFGDVDPRTVTLEDLSNWRQAIEEDVSLREAHRCLKIWRALWKVSAALGYCIKGADPSLGVTNTAPKGRSFSWSEGEVVRLAKCAWRMGYHGLAAVIAVAWDTQFSPGDVRKLRAAQLLTTTAGLAFFTDREKTRKPVGGILCARTLAVIAGYLETLKIELHSDAFIFRNRSGVPYSSDTLGDDFRDVRAAEFGLQERRTLGHDFRRSGAIEAITGHASAEHLSHAMGNTLSASNALFDIYVPINTATLREVVDARRKGRHKLRQNENGPKVGMPIGQKLERGK